MSASFKFLNLGEDIVEYLAERILTNNFSENDFSDILCIFPNKRAYLFLNKILSKKLNSSFFQPQMVTDDEFIKEILSRREIFEQISSHEYLYLIFKTIKNISPKLLKGKKFAEFLPWAKEVLILLEQLDLENINNDFLTNLSEQAKIGFDVSKELNEVLINIIQVRKKIHEFMEKEKKYSRGYMYLKASNLFKSEDVAKYKNVYVCGFLYLQKTELEIFKQLADLDKTEFIFQGSSKDWKVLEKIGKEFNIDILTSQNVTTPNIKLYKSLDRQSLTAGVQSLISSIDDLDENTAIVLLNRDLLLPIISYVSTISQKFNVSLKYPLNRTSVYQLIKFILSAQINRKKDGRYSTKDYLNILLHPISKNWEEISDKETTRIVVHTIEDFLLERRQSLSSINFAKSIFINLEQIECIENFSDTEQNIIKLLHKKLFKDWEGIKTFEEFSSNVIKFIDIIKNFSLLKSHPVNYALCYSLYQKCEELKQATFAKEHFSLKEMWDIFEEILSEESLSFLSSPLNGLQILGLFETHLLNFDNVIFVEANEGCLPSNMSYKLLPKDLQITLGIDRLKYFDEIQKYAFMRLVFSSKNCHIFYCENDEQEKSRFIEQLKLLLLRREDRKKSFNEIESEFSITIKTKQIPKKEKIKKEKHHIEYLKNFKYSPTYIDAYLLCPKKFYFENILGLEENKEISEEVEANEIGTFFHELLEEVYKEILIRAPVFDEAFLEKLLTKCRIKFKKDFTKRYDSWDFVLLKIFETALIKFHKNEQNAGISKIIQLEKEYESVYEIDNLKLKLCGKIDRIDQLKDGTIRIIDYKTGKIDKLPSKKIEKFTSMEKSRKEIKHLVKSFQLPIYLHLLLRQGYSFENLNAVLYSLKESKTYPLWDDKISLNDRTTLFGLYLECLDFIFREILNPEVDFEPDDEDDKMCKNCTYRLACR